MKTMIASLFTVAALTLALPAEPARAAPPSPKRGKLKNIILMICDGCGRAQLEAASYYRYGAKERQVYYSFPTVQAMSTYSLGGSYDPAIIWRDFQQLNRSPTDSAAAATALSTGVKAINGMLGVDPNGRRLKHLMERAEQRGMATGVVSTVPFSHATPAGFVVHHPSRHSYEAIAKQMIYDSATDVIMGCGHPWFDNDGRRRKTAGTYRYVGGQATWAALEAGTAGGDADGDGVADPWTLVESLSAFKRLSHGATPKRVIGVPEVYLTLQQRRSGPVQAAPYAAPLVSSVPTLEQMSSAALNVLDEDPDGLVLMIEGGAVDWAGHANQPGRIIEEQADFDRAVRRVVDWVERNSNWGETLLVVTADHETGYLLGPGSGVQSSELWKPLVNYGSFAEPGMEFYSHRHTNSLVPFFAKGAAARYFKRRATGVDPRYGRYLDNTDVGAVVLDLLR